MRYIYLNIKITGFIFCFTWKSIVIGKTVFIDSTEYTRINEVSVFYALINGHAQNIQTKVKIYDHSDLEKDNNIDSLDVSLQLVNISEAPSVGYIMYDKHH